MSVIALLGFVGMVLIVLTLMHYYIWRRAIRSTTRAGGRGRRIGTWLLVAALVFIVIALVGNAIFPLEVATPLAWIGYGWLGFAFYLFVFLLIGELVRLGVRLLGKGRSASVVAATAMVVPLAKSDRTNQPDRTNGSDRSEPDRTNQTDGPDDATRGTESGEVTRRLFLSRSIALGAGVAAVGVGGYGISRAMREPVVRLVPIQLAGLDPRLAGFRIAMFADAHLGTIRRKAAMEQIVDVVNGTEPDLVAVLGDLIDGSVADLGGDVAPIAGLQSAHGSFFVTGNHEYYSGAQEWVEFLPDLGVRVLRNERLAIESDGAAFDLAGVNDLTGEDYGDGPDYEQALAGRSPDRPVVLLAHQPVTVDQAVAYGVDLQLCGHTHAGQMWPFHYVVAAQQGAVSGLSRIEDTQLYVTSGVGFWGPPMRVGADPEVIVIELQPARID